MQLKKAHKIERNLSCPCGSGKKYKKCCLKKQLAEEERQREAKRSIENAE